MNIFDGLTMIGGLCLFLFGMNIMGEALERRAGGKLRSLLSKLTTNKLAGFLTGLGITSVIQSSSATTVMVVGFVNSGLMSLRQAINVIMGANVGTTVTAWILSLSGIGDGNFFIRLLNPSSFTPILALIGIIFYMFLKDSTKKDTGAILLGFATLMFGMETMSSAVAGLAELPEFRNLFLLFSNPLLGLLAGAVLTAIIQSSSASVGILQALALTGQVPLNAAIPIIMGNGIGTCVTALLSSVGANKDARRAALAHLSFNVIGSAVWLSVYWIVYEIFHPLLLTQSATVVSIAIVNTTFKMLNVLLLLPISGLLEKLVIRLIPDNKKTEVFAELDERLLSAPPLALARCRDMVSTMASYASEAFLGSLDCLDHYSRDLAEKVRSAEDKTDRYEDMLGTYLVKLSSHHISEADSAEAVELLKLIGDIERIADHGVNLLESAEEMKEKNLQFSSQAKAELSVLTNAVREVLDLALRSFSTQDTALAAQVEPLEEVIDELKELLRTRHILRLQQGNCSIEAGFIWSDLLTNLERTSDHCSNISGCVIDAQQHNLNLHASLRAVYDGNSLFRSKLEEYRQKYRIDSVIS